MPLVLSAETVEIDGICYNLNENVKSAEVVAKSSGKYSGNVVIPGSVTYGGVTYKVSNIGTEAFASCTGMTSVSIPNSITVIGSRAFRGCENLTAVYISDLSSWLRISFYTAYMAHGYDYSCNPLYFAHHLFLNGVEVKNLVIPEAITEIETAAFYGCSSLTSVTIPNGIRTIGYKAFYDCTGLTAVYASSVADWCNINFVGEEDEHMQHRGEDDFTSNPLSLAGHLYIGGNEIRDLVIPSTITAISYASFYGCNGLISVNIPRSVTSVHNNAFTGCNNIQTLSISSSSLCGKKAFSGSNLRKFIIDTDEVYEFGKYVKDGSKVMEVVIGNNATKICENAFNGMPKLKSITIGSSVGTIEARAFAGLEQLEKVKCKSPEVPITNRTAFENSYIDYVALSVPSKSVQNYKSSLPWKGFKSISGESGMTYTLTYVVDGETYKTLKYEAGDIIIPESEPAKEGYTFSGWSDFPETMPAKDITVTGTFVLLNDKFKLTYIVDGEVYKSYDIKIGSTIIPETEPTKEGYTFSGWSDIPEEMPAHDVTITGTFTRDSLKKCATPTINIINGELVFGCGMDDVEYHYDIKHLDVKSGEGNNVKLGNTYRISVYASKDGYEDSDVTTKDFQFAVGKKGDIDGNGVVNAADVVQLTDIIMSGTE